eukprot:6174767-Pleurochrysis_carterae.AAC.2
MEGNHLHRSLSLLVADAEFCEARHMRPYVPAATGSSAPDAINQVKTMDIVRVAVCRARVQQSLSSHQANSHLRINLRRMPV